MASTSDIGATLAGMISGYLYPTGTSNPCAAGVPCIVYPGWPTENDLDADLLKIGLADPTGRVHVSIWPTAMDRNTSRFPLDWQQIGSLVKTLTLTQVGQVITVGGTVSIPQNVGIITLGAASIYAVQAGDTLTSIATALTAALTGNGVSATSTGPVITLASSVSILAARVGSFGIMSRELRRQEKQFQIIIWADTPTNREAVSKVIDAGLAPLSGISLPDGFGAKIVFVKEIENDAFQKAKLYRRDFFYVIEYPTTETVTGTEVISSLLDVAPTVVGSTSVSIIG